MTDTKRLLDEISQNVKDVAAGRVVSAQVMISNGGFSHGRVEHFRPVNPAEGHKARFFKMDGNVQDVFERVRPNNGSQEVWYHLPERPNKTIHSAFVPVGRNAVVTFVPRSDVFLWSGEEAQKRVNDTVKTERYVLSSVEPKRNFGASIRNFFVKTLG